MADAVILILDDDAKRIERFTAALRTVVPDTQIMHWRSAKKMIREAAPHLSHACLISLDHDLYPEAGSDDDPGDGLEVAKFLAEMRPGCPIIIHSSNGDRARMMAGEFELAGCAATRVAPLGEDWVENYWAETVRSLLRRGE